MTRKRKVKRGDGEQLTDKEGNALLWKTVPRSDGERRSERERYAQWKSLRKEMGQEAVNAEKLREKERKAAYRLKLKLKLKANAPA